ncbi:hypothetical protein HK102_011100, partial [Quaeritorhiza haematococci]
MREQLALSTLEELITYLKTGGGKIGILDATNSTVARRRALLDRVSREKHMRFIFIESICTDKNLLEANMKMKLKGPDYVKVPEEVAMRDFQERIRNYERAYETIGEEEESKGVSFIKIINVGKKVIAYNINGYLQSQCVFYLMQLNISERTIWLTRHGESVYNLYNRIGGDPPLTEAGQRYSRALARFLKTQYALAYMHESSALLSPSTPNSSTTTGTTTTTNTSSAAHSPMLPPDVPPPTPATPSTPARRDSDVPEEVGGYIHGSQAAQQMIAGSVDSAVSSGSARLSSSSSGNTPLPTISTSPPAFTTTSALPLAPGSPEMADDNFGTTSRRRWRRPVGPGGLLSGSLPSRH